MNNFNYLSMIDHLMKTSNDIIGYTEYELKKIEYLYGINIQGQLRDFMLLAGRCDGGLLGDDPIILYRSAWDVRTQILFQIKLFTYLQDAKAWDYLGQYGKIFCFSWEWETQYYYLITDYNDDLVYHYDENNETAECTGLTLYEYLDNAYKKYTELYSGERVICKGELINIDV